MVIMEKRLIDPNRSLKQLERDIKNLKVESPCEYKREKRDINRGDIAKVTLNYVSPTLKSVDDVHKELENCLYTLADYSFSEHSYTTDESYIRLVEKIKTLKWVLNVKEIS